ncbi:unnamed protein product [Closterium sp. Yama58-4]|nr:unnamed protein product [Closterium sp. Yama58-4]
MGSSITGWNLSSTRSPSALQPSSTQEQNRTHHFRRKPATAMSSVHVMLVALWLMTWLATVAFIPAALAASPDTEELLNLKAAFMVSNPQALQSFPDDIDPCSAEWQERIKCNEHGRIIELNLANELLKGPIPGRQLAQLDALERLNMGYNSLTGPIPKDLGALNGLTFLSFEANQLEGPIPDWMAPLLSRLVEIRFANNQFNGSLPRSLGTLRNLTTLDMGSNKLSGELPPQLAYCSNLKLISFPANQLSGPIPEWLGNLKQLEVLEMYTNVLSGPIPTQLALAESLHSIAMDDNQLSGLLPPELGDLPNLSAIYVANNKLEGPIPDSYSKLESLMYLDVSYNEGINGTIPEFLGKMSRIQSIAFEYCDLTGPIPPNLGELQNIVEIFLDNNQLTGDIPPSLGQLVTLNKLFLNHNMLSGAIPVELCQLTNIYDLNLARNQLQGTIPACLTQLPHLATLTLSMNLLTGPVPDVSSTNAVNFEYNGNCLDNVPDQQDVCAAPTTTPPSTDGTPPPTDGTSPPTDGTPTDGTTANPPTADGTTTDGSSSGGGDAASQESPPPPSDAAAAAAAVPTPPPPPPANQGSTPVPGIITIFVFTTALLTLIAAAFYLSYRQKHSDGGNRADQLPVTEYSLSKIKKATRNFTTIYGRGSFGMVYLAEDFFRDQSDPRAIIKRAHDPQKLGEFLFKCKVEVLARARHRYLVNLLGYCVGKGERILVYEYLSNGTLFDRLHRPELEPLPWETRVSIAVNIACALEYLHHGVSPPLVHRAVTSSNILLSHDMSAKLSDFGIARGSGGATSSFEENPRRQRKSRAGRAERGEASEASMQMEKVDVYGFGVVLLELITGQKAMKEVHITSVAAPFLEDAQMMPLMVDPQLGGYFNQSELIELGTIARDCVQEDASSRPTMREVLQTMEERLRLDAHLFDNLNEDDALLVDGYSAAVPAAVTASGRRSGVGFGSLRLSVGGGATSSGRRGESGRWGASVESFAQSIKYVLMSPGRAGSGRGGAGSLPVDDPHDLEMSSLLVMNAADARR